MTLVRSLASLLVLVAPALAAQSAKPIPLRDFFRNPAKAYYQVSQGGKYVSFTEPACEFSIGTTPKIASPLVTRENTSRTLSHGSGSASASGKTPRTARSLYAPGSP